MLMPECKLVVGQYLSQQPTGQNLRLIQRLDPEFTNHDEQQTEKRGVHVSRSRHSSWTEALALEAVCSGPWSQFPNCFDSYLNARVSISEDRSQ